jgi:hypothetical protein
MAKKKDGITDLTKTLVSAAQKFNDTEYNRLQHLIFCVTPWSKLWLYFDGSKILR